MSTHNIPFSIQKRKLPELSKSVAGFFFQRTYNKFGTTVVNESSVFEPLKVYCTLKI